MHRHTRKQSDNRKYYKVEPSYGSKVGSLSLDNMCNINTANEKVEEQNNPIHSPGMIDPKSPQGDTLPPSSLPITDSKTQVPLYRLMAVPVSPLLQHDDQTYFTGDNTYNTMATAAGNMSLEMPFFDPTCPPPFISNKSTYCDGIKATVESPGYISLKLRQGVVVDIGHNQAIRLRNAVQNTVMSLSACATQMAMEHPKGRVLQYSSRIEVQVQDEVSAKNAKVYPRGISFTANNCALVYLVDEAGARSTTDQFHDLYADAISDKMFWESCDCQRLGIAEAVQLSVDQLDSAEFWINAQSDNCWDFGGSVFVRQKDDGLVTIERTFGNERFLLKVSPNNGKARMESSFIHLTASLGLDSHLFVKSGDRRMHYSGQTNLFIVRNGGNSAGFDETGMLTIR